MSGTFTYASVYNCMCMFCILYAAVFDIWYHDMVIFVTAYNYNYITKINCTKEFFNRNYSNGTSNLFSLGYKSNGGSSSSVIAYTVFSGGAFSLSKSKSVQITSNQSGTTVMANNGDSSAHLVHQLIVAQGKSSVVTCSGFSSCSNIGHLEVSLILSCSGDQSCAYSSIYSNQNQILSAHIVASGAYSLMNSIIYVKGTDTILTIKGHYAAFNATLYCLKSSTCTIYCYDNGCVNFRFKCNNCTYVYRHYSINGSNSHNFCGETLYSNANIALCPVNIDVPIPNSSLNDIPSNPFYSTTTALDWRSNSYPYGLAQMMDEICSGKSKNGTDYDGDKCKQSSVDDYVYDDAYERTNDMIDGRETGSTDDTSICCRGYESCTNMNIIRSDDNVICSGAESCLNAESLTASTVYCSGYSSCASSLFTYGIYFEDIVYCLGALSCAGSTISNGTLVYCGGELACKNITIFNVKRVIMATGFDSNGGTITSSSGTNTRLTLIGYVPVLPSYIGGVNLEVVCGDVCLIECNTPSSCSSNLKVDCIGGAACYIVCNYTMYGLHVHCPPEMNGNYTIINSSWIDHYNQYNWPWQKWFTDPSTGSPSPTVYVLPTEIPTNQPSPNPSKSHVTTTLSPAGLMTTSYNTMTVAQFEFGIIGVFDLSVFVSNVSRRLADNEQTVTSPRVCIVCLLCSV